MCSDPAVRSKLYKALDAAGGVVSGRSYGAVVRELLSCDDISVTAAKAALNSLARSKERRPVVEITRSKDESGLVKVTIIRRRTHETAQSA